MNIDTNFPHILNAWNEKHWLKPEPNRIRNRKSITHETLEQDHILE